MEAQEILALIATHGVLEEKLCYYDVRNPDCILIDDIYSEDEIKAFQNRKDCYCENCFDGRTKFAQTLLAIKLGLMK